LEGELEIILQQLLNGLTLGGIYALIALGYTMIYGIVKLINFAHGDIFMVGSFIGLFIALKLSANIVVVMLGAMVFCAVLGFLVERSAYRPLRDPNPRNLVFTAVFVLVVLFIAFLSQNSLKTLVLSPKIWLGAVIFLGFTVWLVVSSIKKGGRRESSRINALISAIGMSIVISNMVGLIHGPKRATYPEIIKFSEINIAGIGFSGLQIFIIASSFILMFILNFIVHRTKAGIAMRAVSQNINAARLMGINPNRVVGFTFALGSALAGAAGVLVGIFYTVADHTMGSLYGLKAFVAAVLGGIGSIPGAMFGGFMLGIAEVFGVGFLDPQLRDAIAFGILIIVLIARPAGFFGSAAREKV
jgi:branched-chain amino acid transport system permease protein